MKNIIYCMMAGAIVYMIFGIFGFICIIGFVVIGELYKTLTE